MAELHELIQAYSNAKAGSRIEDARRIRDENKANVQFLAIAESLDGIQESLAGTYTEPFVPPRVAEEGCELTPHVWTAFGQLLGDTRRNVHAVFQGAKKGRGDRTPRRTKTTKVHETGVG